MKNIDEVFENNSSEKNFFGGLFEGGSNGLPSSIRKFRNKYNKGAFTLDVRANYEVSKTISLGFVIQNVSNTIYSQRPAIIAPPRSFTLQLMAEL